jgi:predicted nucleic acid-binding protein
MSLRRYMAIPAACGGLLGSGRRSHDCRKSTPDSGLAGAEMMPSSASHILEDLRSDRSFDLPRHQRHLGHAAQDATLRYDRLARVQRCRAGIAEIAFAFGKIRPGQGGAPGTGHGRLASPFCRPIFLFTEVAALAYGAIISAALRQGKSMTAPDGMIAAIARINGGRLATRNLPDFETTGLELICPWDF